MSPQIQAGMPCVETAEARQQIAAIFCQTPVRIDCDSPHGGGQARPIADASVRAVNVLASLQDG